MASERFSTAFAASAETLRNQGKASPATPGGATSTRGTGKDTPPATSRSEQKQRPSSARLSPGRFGATMSSSSRSRPPSYTARLSAHAQTHSPSGRYHPDPLMRREIRKADITSNIDYYAPNGAPDNDRKMKEASWLCSQAFIESLRSYPDPFRKSPIVMPGESIAYDGNTQSARRPHTEHVETAMRRRLSIAPVDDEWLPEQCPVRWPDNIAEGKWRPVGPIRPEDFNEVIRARYGYSGGAEGNYKPGTMHQSPMRRKSAGDAPSGSPGGEGGVFGGLFSK